MYSDDDRTHTEFHLDRRSFGVTNLWFSLNFDFPKIGLFTLRIILCASVDLFSTISSINKLFKIYRGTLIDIIDDGDDRRHSWVVLCFNKIGQTNIYPQYEHEIKPVKGAIKMIDHERWAIPYSHQFAGPDQAPFWPNPDPDMAPFWPKSGPDSVNPRERSCIVWVVLGVSLYAMLVLNVNLQFMWYKNITVSDFIETLDYQKDTLAFLSDNDELFVSNLEYKKAAPNSIFDRINCFL